MSVGQAIVARMAQLEAAARSETQSVMYYNDLVTAKAARGESVDPKLAGRQKRRPSFLSKSCRMSFTVKSGVSAAKALDAFFAGPTIAECGLGDAGGCSTLSSSPSSAPRGSMRFRPRTPEDLAVIAASPSRTAFDLQLHGVPDQVCDGAGATAGFLAGSGQFFGAEAVAAAKTDKPIMTQVAILQSMLRPDDAYISYYGVARVPDAKAAGNARVTG